jgi:hypothetical protein
MAGSSARECTNRASLPYRLPGTRQVRSRHDYSRQVISGKLKDLLTPQSPPGKAPSASDG